MQKQSSLKKIVTSIPGLGYVARLTWHILSLPKQHADIRSVLEKSENTQRRYRKESTEEIQSLGHTVEGIAKAISDKGHAQQQLANRIADLNHQIQLLSKNGPRISGKSSSSDSPGDLLADDHSLDKFYIDFENKFRGSEAEIEERLLVYLPYFKNQNLDYKKHPVLDIGCGRGELLKVLAGEDINSIGLDINESMVKRATELGHKAVQADAMDYLSNQKANSFSAITGFHIAEHIPFNTLLRMFEECYRVLVPGGFIIFETPNPESIHVGSFSFYFDPSHLHPIPPDMLAFTLENRGFDRAEILRLHPKREDYSQQTHDHDEFTTEIIDRFFGPQDYSVIGYKSK
jgi:O-antigen chain-terminating methyltransferase